MAASKWAFCITLTIAVCFSLTAAALTKDPKSARLLGGRGGAFGIWSKPEVLAMEPAAASDWEESPPDVLAMEPAATSDWEAHGDDHDDTVLSLADFGVVSEPYAYQTDAEVVSEPYAFQTKGRNEYHSGNRGVNREADDSTEPINNNNYVYPIGLNSIPLSNF